MKKLPVITWFFFAVLLHLACSKTYNLSSPSFPSASAANGRYVTTFAGQAGVTGAANATGTAASFNGPSGVAVDSSGNVYVADTGNELIRLISPGGVVSTLAGQAGVTGAANGPGAMATFSSPEAIAVDLSGNVYVADQGNYLIRKITPAGVVSTLAGSGTYGSSNGPGTAASFDNLLGIAVDSSGNVYVTDEGNALIRMITPGGMVSTLAGQVGVGGKQNGIGTAATFNGPEGVAVDSSGNVYVTEWSNGDIRLITSGAQVSTFGGPQQYSGLLGIALDSSENVYTVNRLFNDIREVTHAGVETMFAGSGATGATNGSYLVASFNDPVGIAVDSSGNVYVADSGNNLIREIIP